MQISARIAAIIAVIFALACLCFAAQGLMALDEIKDATVAADSRGYAYFWGFLGLVGLAIAAATWWISRTPIDRDGNPKA
jgi:hypothetical protein